MAIIRPAKRQLMYKDWTDIMKDVWIKPSTDGSYFFKKSHAVAYAQAIVVQMNLISRAKYSFRCNTRSKNSLKNFLKNLRHPALIEVSELDSYQPNSPLDEIC